jgi:fumarate hydratase class II
MATTTETKLRWLPIGTGATGTRVESDSLGSLEVPGEHYWGAQTQRSLIRFAIGDDQTPKAVYHAYGYVKKAAALVNQAAGRLDYQRAEAIVVAADEVIAGKLDSEFPLHVWQTGSGTHWDMNVNEVISNRASQLLGGELGTKKPVHPNDHVNMGQSASDTFLTAMHIATLREVRQHTLPHVSGLIDSVWIKAVEWAEVVEISRTQLQDATPLTLGQKWSASATQLRDARRRLGITLDAVHGGAAGDPAVGARPNAPDGFAEQVAAKLAKIGHS